MQLLTPHFVVFNQLWNIWVHSAKTQPWAGFIPLLLISPAPIVQGRAEGAWAWLKQCLTEIMQMSLLSWIKLWSLGEFRARQLFPQLFYPDTSNQSQELNWKLVPNTGNNAMHWKASYYPVLLELDWLSPREHLSEYLGKSFLTFHLTCALSDICRNWNSHQKNAPSCQACLFSSSYAAGDWGTWPCSSLESCFMGFFMEWCCFLSRYLSFMGCIGGCDVQVQGTQAPFEIVLFQFSVFGIC